MLASGLPLFSGSVRSPPTRPPLPSVVRTVAASALPAIRLAITASAKKSLLMVGLRWDQVTYHLATIVPPKQDVDYKENIYSEVIRRTPSVKIFDRKFK